MTAVVGWWRGLLAVGLLAGFYVVAFGLLAADTALVLGALWLIVEAPARSSSWALVIGGSLPAVLALVHGIATVSRAEDHPPGAVPLRRAEAPALWTLTEELAGRLRTRPPSRIYLTPEVNASVSEEARMLGFAVGRRTLYLGVPLLRLEPLELRAVLCHELGHYAGRHTRFGAVTHRGAASLRSTLFRLRMTARADQSRIGYARFFQAVIGAYAWVYLRLSLAVRRRQELEADAGAVAEAGPAATAGALRSVYALGVLWTGFVEEYLRPVQRLGYAPENVFEAFGAMLDHPLIRQQAAQLRARPAEPERSPLDSHPPLARRLALIESRPPGPARPAAVPGPLLTGPGPALRVQRELLRGAGGPGTTLPLAAWGGVAAEALAVGRARLLLEAAARAGEAGTTGPTGGTAGTEAGPVNGMGGAGGNGGTGEVGGVGGRGGLPEPTLGTVLGLLERGERNRLARQLPGGARPGGRLAETLYALAGQALTGAGRGRWVLGWAQGPLLDSPLLPRGRLEDLVRGAVRDRAGAGALRRELAGIGVDVGAPVGLAVAPGGRKGPRRAPAAPNPVVEELGRQRTVARITMCALAAVGVVWAVSLVGADDPSGTGPPVYRPSPYVPRDPYGSQDPYGSWSSGPEPPAGQPVTPGSGTVPRPGLSYGAPAPSLSFAPAPALSLAPAPER
ncbi:M48 family metalloprotease [Streptomyces sp. NPDC052077]|uniref:M48 family metalloprotease n=1 Tax=Streptomyces sp. NPDC052077 TaxID=3154757 RepID=UPI003424481B